MDPIGQIVQGHAHLPNHLTLVPMQAFPTHIIQCSLFLMCSGKAWGQVKESLSST